MDTVTERLEKIAPWGVLGVAVTVVGVLVSLGIFYWQENSTKVDAKWYVRNEEKLVEVRETIKDLRILYQGQDILESGQELRILTLEFVNGGRVINEGDYYKKLDFGLWFPGSDIITFKVVDCRVGDKVSEFLRENFRPTIQISSVVDESTHSKTNAKALVLPFLQFDRKSAASVKAYLLHSNRNEQTAIVSLGKIAGMDKIPVVSALPIQAAARDNRWLPILTALISVVAGLATYAFGLRAKAIANDKERRLQDMLRKELQVASQQIADEGATRPSPDNPQPRKLTGPTETPPAG